nr:uncharacterized protein LOC128690443 [Cherax quadricarinatus]
MPSSKSPVVGERYRKRHEDEDDTIASWGHDNPAFVGVTEEGEATASPQTRSSTHDAAVHTISVSPQTGKGHALPEKVLSLKQNTQELPKDKRSQQRETPKEDIHSSEEEGKSAVAPQVVASVLAALTQVALGTIIGLPGVILPQLTDRHSSDLYLGINQVALFGKYPYLSTI